MLLRPKKKKIENNLICYRDLSNDLMALNKPVSFNGSQ
jgi:hypothetical protein